MYPPVKNYRYKDHNGADTTIFRYKANIKRRKLLFTNNNKKAVISPFDLREQTFSNFTTTIHIEEYDHHLKRRFSGKHSPFLPFLAQMMFTKIFPGYSTQPIDMVRAIKMEFY